MGEIIFVFFMASGVFAWGVVAYVVINLLWESK
jgi:hypothetical protein